MIKNILHIHSKLPAVYRDVIKSKMNMIIKKIAGSDTHKKKNPSKDIIQNVENRFDLTKTS